MKTKNYNVIPLSIDKGLDGVQVGTAGGYIRLLEAPATAEVFIHLNDKQADGIPLKVYHAIEATDIERIFVTCNAIPGETIKIVQANTAENFKMVTPASDVKLSALGSYESVALDQLDKIINPYVLDTVSAGTNNNTTEAVFLSKTTTADKLRVRLIASSQSISFLYSNSKIRIEINGTPYAFAGGFHDNYRMQIIYINEEILCKSGDLIEIIGSSYDTGQYTHFVLEEYTKKP